MKRSRRKRPLLEYRVAVNGLVFGPGPDLGRYLAEAKRRFPGAIPWVQLYRINSVAIFRLG